MRRLPGLIAVIVLSVSCTLQKTDVLIIGGGASGSCAAIQAGRMGVDVLLVEEGPWLGGMLSSAGVCAIDGNYRLRSGIFGEFTDSLASIYGGYQALNSAWVSNILFEPHVADEVLKGMVAALPSVEVVYGVSCVDISKGRRWRVILSDGRVVRAKLLVDGTELGDVAAMCGAGYDLGMDSRENSGELNALVESNDIVQDLTYVAILKDYDRDVTIDEPADYRPELYYNSALGSNNNGVVVDGGIAKTEDSGQVLWSVEKMLEYGRLPVWDGAKYMLNWPISGNDCYVNMVEMTPEQRSAAVDSAKNVTLGFIYYMQTEYGLGHIGIADDEFPTEDGLPLIPYHRESRRIHGEVRFTMDDAAEPFARDLYRTGIAVGDYPVDHHHHRCPQWNDSYELWFYPVPSYSLPLGVMLPSDVDELIVTEKSMSVSNLINGTTRLQPVVMQAGQAAGALAALAILRHDGNLREVGVREVQEVLLESGGYIMPYLDLPPEHPHFKALQRIGATGIMRGEGRSLGWSNVTYFRTNDPLMPEDVFIEDYYPGMGWEELGLPAYDSENPMTRESFAVAIDSLLHPFESFPVDYLGHIK